MPLTPMTLENSVSVTRSTTGMCWDKNGIYSSVAINTARINHDPVTKKAIGILSEGTRTNFFRRSNEFSNAQWVKGSGLAFTTDSAQKAPDGTPMPLATLSTASNHQFFQILSAPLTPSTMHTISIYVVPKKGLFPLQIAYYDGSNPVNTVNVTPEAIGKLQLISFTFETPAAAVAAPQVRFIGVGSGSEGDQIYVWGAQVEAGNDASSRIYTVDAQATRASDGIELVSPKPVNGLRGGSMVVSCISNAQGLGKYLPAVCEYGSTVNYSMALFSAVGRISIESRVGAAAASASSDAQPGAAKIATRRSDTVLSLCVNGGNVSSSGSHSAATNFTTAGVRIGSGQPGSILRLEGTIVSVELFNKMLTDTEMKEYTK